MYFQIELENLKVLKETYKGPFNNYVTLTFDIFNPPPPHPL